MKAPSVHSLRLLARDEERVFFFCHHYRNRQTLVTVASFTLRSCHSAIKTNARYSSYDFFPLAHCATAACHSLCKVGALEAHDAG